MCLTFYWESKIDLITIYRESKYLIDFTLYIIQSYFTIFVCWILLLKIYSHSSKIVKFDHSSM